MTTLFRYHVNGNTIAKTITVGGGGECMTSAFQRPSERDSVAFTHRKTGAFIITVPRGMG